MKWKQNVSLKDFTYVNTALNNFSCNDLVVTTNNIFDCILDKYVTDEMQNASDHEFIIGLIFSYRF